MGAISGIVSLEPGRPIERAIVQRMIDSMRHRGPDRAGVWVGDGVGLAHRGLELEHEAGGTQPLTSTDGALAITFSGELFNRLALRGDLEAAGVKCSVGSDADLVLRSYERYGESCVDAFNGQFAFAIWDHRKRSVFLARDAVGICPLHYATAGGALVFASEAKAFWRIRTSLPRATTRR
jgi:asparagine synthase (glutamine-hydrolysing)